MCAGDGKMQNAWNLKWNRNPCNALILSIICRCILLRLNYPFRPLSLPFSCTFRVSLFGADAHNDKTHIRVSRKLYDAAIDTPAAFAKNLCDTRVTHWQGVHQPQQCKLLFNEFVFVVYGVANAAQLHSSRNSFSNFIRSNHLLIKFLNNHTDAASMVLCSVWVAVAIVSSVAICRVTG